MLQSQIESIVLFMIHERGSLVGTLLSYPGERGNETGQLSRKQQQKKKTYRHSEDGLLALVNLTLVGHDDGFL